ncbi:hypothetical protein SAMD00079811_81170 (plasmid) [Scytonema sp. HK-05]|uniref:DUF4058 family protein n=1 Tax=Scytonema sp. HK-05 TaxID=1137095 RepID=UPI0009364E37|nr:DUF4058 family protein [Scytonema sp. HK-05]OKH58206.1 hypothetical protein NIES2130_16115 [Scytonema sp. HK-05]BAY50488.1 hypothetical protein SAMD00079811_81170 [Scytonema sp. HK-05]
MPSLFPGMNPYLEHPAFWSSFHTRLLVASLLRRSFANADAVAPQLRPKYYIEVETRTYQDRDGDEVLVGIPDATILKASSSNMG